MREAFALLQAEGLVSIDPHRGAIVFLPSVAELQEYYEIREALETLAITLALPNLEESLLDELDELIAQMREIAEEQEWEAMNEDFHGRLYAPSGRPRLMTMISTLRDASSTYINMYVSAQSPKERSNDDHQLIVDACRTRDPEKARAAVSHHLRHTARELAELIQDPHTAAAS